MKIYFRPQPFMSPIGHKAHASLIKEAPLFWAHKKMPWIVNYPGPNGSLRSDNGACPRCGELAADWPIKRADTKKVWPAAAGE